MRTDSFVKSFLLPLSLLLLAAINLSAQKSKNEISDPKVFELANIAFALTDFAAANPNMTEKRGDYYARVTKHFAAQKDHALIRLLDEKVKKNYLFYVVNRGYAINFAFGGDGKLTETNLYPPTRKIQTAIYGDAFADKTLWEDFAAQSDFRKFYADNEKFYQRRLAEAGKLLPLDKIQTWLEREFPERFDRYSIYVSPLIGGTHSTFSKENGGAKECLMFVSDAENYDRKKYTPKQIEGLYTGIVFTEIDHNYSNPISIKHAKEIGAAMPNLTKWSNGAEAKNSAYQPPLKTFDEYATHSLYLLYVNDNFPAKDYEIIREQRVELMSKRRGFSKFREFHEEFWRLYKSKKPSEKSSDLYPKIIEWMKAQN